MGTFLPRSDSGLSSWSTNFDAKIAADAASVGLTSTEATDYHERHVAFLSCLEVTGNPDTKSKTSVLAKTEAAKALRQAAGTLSRRIHGFSGITPELLTSLGLNVPKHRSTVTAPTVRPGMDSVGVDGKRWTVRAHRDDAESKRGKPPHCIGAKFYYYVGSSYPADLGLWEYAGDTGKSEFTIVLPESLAAGTQVWATCVWVTRSYLTGPLAVPITTRVQYNGEAAPTTMSIAA